PSTAKTHKGRKATGGGQSANVVGVHHDEIRVDTFLHDALDKMCLTGTRRAVKNSDTTRRAVAIDILDNHVKRPNNIGHVVTSLQLLPYSTNRANIHARLSRNHGVNVGRSRQVPLGGRGADGVDGFFDELGALLIGGTDFGATSKLKRTVFVRAVKKQKIS